MIVRYENLADVQFCHSVMSHSLQPHGLQHTRLPCPSPSPRACSSTCPLSRWCHPIMSSSVIPFSSCLQSFPASRSFPVSQLLASGVQSTEASASTSVLSMNIQDWFPLDWQGLISFGIDKDWQVWSPCSPRDSQESSLTLQFKSISSLMLSLLYGPTLNTLAVASFFFELKVETCLWHSMSICLVFLLFPFRIGLQKWIGIDEN